MSKPLNATRTVKVEVNGQQEELVAKLVASDPAGRSAEELIRHGFSEFVKMKRLGLV
jgi:hypothetical protein